MRREGGKTAWFSSLSSPSELRWIEIFFKTLEFGFDFGFGVFLRVEDLHTWGRRGGADRVERGFIAGDEFD